MINVTETFKKTVTLSFSDKERLELGSISPKETTAYKEIEKKLENKKKELIEKGFTIKPSTKELTFDLRELTWSFEITAEKAMSDEEAQEYLKKKKSKTFEDLVKEVEDMTTPVMEKMSQLFEKKVEPIFEQMEDVFEKDFKPLFKDCEDIMKKSSKKFKKFFDKERM